MSKNIKVELIAYTPNPLDVVYTAARCCYYAGTPNEMFKKCKDISVEDKTALVLKVVKSQHTSVLEHVSLTFAISGIDRNCSHQLVRKRIASYSQQSLRYTNIAKDLSLEELYPFIGGNVPIDKGVELASKYYTDVTEHNYLYYLKSLIVYLESIKEGAKKEEARNYLCSNIRTNLVMTLNLRSFLDLLAHRLCTRAQFPIRFLVSEMAKEVSTNKDFDFIQDFLGSKCIQLGYCTEENSCGKMKKLN